MPQRVKVVNDYIWVANLPVNEVVSNLWLPLKFKDAPSECWMTRWKIFKLVQCEMFRSLFQLNAIHLSSKCFPDAHITQNFNPGRETEGKSRISHYLVISDLSSEAQPQEQPKTKETWARLENSPNKPHCGLEKESMAKSDCAQWGRCGREGLWLGFD